jgi:hypothetical protein
MDGEINFISGGKPPVKKNDDDEVELIEWTHPSKSPYDEQIPETQPASGAVKREIKAMPEVFENDRKPKLAEKHVQYNVAEETKSSPAKEPLKHETTSYAQTPFAKLYEGKGPILSNKSGQNIQPAAMPGKKGQNTGLMFIILNFFKNIFGPGKLPNQKIPPPKTVPLENKAVDIGNFANVAKPSSRNSLVGSGMQSTQGSMDGVDIIETNLIKDPTNMFINWQQHLLSLSLFILIPALIVILFLLGFNFMEREMQKDIISKQVILQNLNNEIAVYEQEVIDKDMQANLSKIRVAKSMLENHIYWTKFFAFLEENTLKNTYYAGFQGSTSGKYSLTAATENLRSISEQFKHFRTHPMLKDVSVTGGQSAPSNSKDNPLKPSVSYIINFSIDPSIFTK